MTQVSTIAAPRHRLDAAAGRRTVTGMCLIVLVAVLSGGCRAVQTTVDLPARTVRAVTPGKSDTPVVDPVEVQQAVLRLTDAFATRMILDVEKLRRGRRDADPAEVLQWKIAIGTETSSIASGPNPVANLLDLTVFITVTRMALEDHWQPEVFGNSAGPMLDNCRIAEAEIWQLAGMLLEPEQQEELRQAIEDWRGRNPLPEDVFAARALGFTSRMTPAKTVDAARPGSVFSLLRVDPLAGMDPAVREIAQTRLVAERVLYVAQKMPMLLRWQTELLTLNTTELPAVRQWTTTSAQIAEAVQRFTAVAEKLPAQASAEREAILKALESQERDLTTLLTAGTRMSDSLNTTIATFDALMQRFGVGETNTAPAPETSEQPFRIQDYTATAAQLEVTARQLTELLLAFDRTLGSTNLTQLSAQAAPVMDQAKTGGKEVVDYAFVRGVLLVVVLLVAALIYRFLGSHLTVYRSRTLST